LRRGLERAHLGLMQPLRVLLVEDDALIGVLLAELLRGMGHEVCETAATEAAAVTAAERCAPDLMIVDARLGRGSGIAAVDEILRVRPVAHFFLSGDAEGVRMLRPGAVVVRKPFRIADIERAIDSAFAAVAVAT
jgi:two-component system, response regulator PdtaR